MRNILALIGAAVVGFAGLGWYLGWYSFTTAPGADGHVNVNIDVNKKKIQDTEHKVIDVIKQETTPAQMPTPTKTVEGQTTGIQINPDGSASIVLPKIEVKSGK